jgi:hypothetical protein
MKNKGCRQSDQIIQEITHVSTHYGAAKYRHEITLPADINHLQKRLDELHIEINEARKQEAAQKKEGEAAVRAAEPTMLEVVQ